MTFSIIARDEQTGNLGGGVSTHWFKCHNVLWGKSGVGIIATQAETNYSFGSNGLDLLKKGLSSKQAVETLTSKDEGRDFRQLGILDANGDYHQFTGKKCIRDVSTYHGKNFCVQTNMMVNKDIADAVGRSYESNDHLNFENRILEALKAGEKAGGDIRGKQSSALVIYSGDEKKEWEEKLVGLSVDDHENPLGELERLLNINNAYKFLLDADSCIVQGKYKEALDIYIEAEKILPESIEIKFWKGVSLVNTGSEKEGKVILEEIYKNGGDNWKELYSRL